MSIRKIIGGVIAVAIVATFGMVSLPTDGWAQIEEMVVTARKREEFMQDVPIAISSFNLKDIERKGIDSIDDLALLSSSIQMDTAGRDDQRRIVVRGLSPTRGKSNIAIMVDGIDTTSESITTAGLGNTINPRLFDLERIEVVKGPQSALWGRSAFNGAINYVTRDPSDEWESSIMVEAAEHDRYQVKGSISGPITDTLSFRLNAAGWDQEGFFRNERTGDKVGGADGWGAAITLKWEPKSNLWFKGRFEYTDDTREQNAGVTLVANNIVAIPEGACIDQIDHAVDGDDHSAARACGDNHINVGFAQTEVGDWEGGETIQAVEDLIKDFINDGVLNGNPCSAGPVTEDNPLTAAYTCGLLSHDPFAVYEGVIPGMSELGPLSLSPDPRTGKDFPGTDREMWRASLIGEWQPTDWLTVTSMSGIYDTQSTAFADWQAGGNLDNCGTFVDPVATAANVAADGITDGGGDDAVPAVISKETVQEMGWSCQLNVSGLIFDNTQYSQELRFASDWDSHTQVTLGGNWWWEDRDFNGQGGTIRSRSMECALETGGDEPVIDPADLAIVGPCGVFSVPITGEIYQQVLDARELAHDGHLNGEQASRKTEHWSAYFLLETDLDDLFSRGVDGDDFLPGNWSLTLEGRWNHEIITMSGTDAVGTGATGVQVCGGGPIISSRVGDSDGLGTQASANNACSGVAIDMLGNQHTGGPPGLPITVANYDTPLCGTSQISPADQAAIEASGNLCDGDPTSVFNVASNKAEWFIGKTTLQWEPTDDMMWYFSHAWARKPEGYNTTSFGSKGFEPSIDLFNAEKMRVYELGVKSQWFGNQLQVNGAGFFQDFTDKAVTTQLPIIGIDGEENSAPIIEFAGGAEVWGGEIDVLWAPDWEDPLLSGRVSLQGSYTYLRTKFTDFTTITSSGTDIPVNGNCTPFLEFNAATGENDVPSCIVSRTGNRLEDAPKHAATISSSWVAPLANTDFEMFLEIDAQYTGNRYLEDENTKLLNNWWNSNLRIGVQNDRFELLFFVNNLFDGDAVQQAHTIPGLSATFTFIHVGGYDIDNGGAGGAGGPNALSFMRGGPHLNSAVPVATLRPPRFFGVRASVKF